MPGSRHAALWTGVLVAVLLGAGGASLRARWAPDLWSQRSDYAPLDLGHALNYEMASRGALPRPVQYYQLYHPGLPLQVTSWLALRLGSGAGNGADGDPIGSAMRTLRDPAGYWRATAILTAALTLAALIGLAAAARRLPPLAAAAVVASYFCLDSAWVSGFVLLTNDTFALPLAVALLLLARHVFAAERPPWGGFAAAGCVAAVAYLCKLPYAIWSAAFGAGLLVRLLISPPGSRLAWVRGGAVFAAGWLATFLALTGLLMTPAAVAEMLRLHFGTATHSGYHSGGAGSLIDLETLRFGLTRLTDHPLFLAMLAMLAAGLVSVVRSGADRERRREWPFATTVAVAVVLVLAAVVKHYKIYYLLVALSFVPVAMAWCLSALPAQWRSRLALATLALCLASFASQHARPPMEIPHWSRYVPWQGAAEEIAAIEKLPLGPGEVRAWAYGSIGAGYYRQFAAAISGYGALLARVHAEFPRDRASEEPSLNWRYAIYEWNLIDPDVDDPGSLALFAGMRAEAQARLALGVPLAGFKRYLVIERRKGAPPAPPELLTPPPAER